MANYYLMGKTSQTQMFGCVIKTKLKVIVIYAAT